MTAVFLIIGNHCEIVFYGSSQVTHDEMMAFEKYRKGTGGSRALALEVVRFLASEYGVAPKETVNKFLDYPGKFLLIETIDSRKTSLVIKLADIPEKYAEFRCPHVRVKDKLNKYYFKLYITNPDGLPNALAAIRLLFGRKNCPTISA